MKETLELKKAAKSYKDLNLPDDHYDAFIAGAKWITETLYTKQDLIDLIQGLKDYTKESNTILGYDDRDASEFADIFLNKQFGEEPEQDYTPEEQGWQMDELMYSNNL
jgi:hypothetical protein